MDAVAQRVKPKSALAGQSGASAGKRLCLAARTAAEADRHCRGL